MKTSFRSLAFVLTLTAASLLGTAAAQAQTVINSLPYTITSSGDYVLTSNLNSSQTSGNLITVNASNVSIDFQNHYIAGPVGNTSQSTYGILANERSNLAIKNGTIAYCYRGIELEGNGTATTNSVNHQIDNMRVTYCTYLGIAIFNGPGSRITNCQVSQTGFSGQTSAYGIDAAGTGTVAQNNVVSIVTATNSYGILADPGSFIRQNTVSNAKYGVYGGKYQDNLTAGCTTPYSNGTDAGGNN